VADSEDRPESVAVPVWVLVKWAVFEVLVETELVLETEAEAETVAVLSIV
jgi:hypothetical protein